MTLPDGVPERLVGPLVEEDTLMVEEKELVGTYVLEFE
jgi:hypothetical protein